MAGFARTPPFSFARFPYRPTRAEGRIRQAPVQRRCIRGAMKIPVIVLMAMLAAVSGCGRQHAGPPPETPTTNPQTGSTKVDPESPKAGMNTSRPDSIQDVQPEPSQRTD